MDLYNQRDSTGQMSFIKEGLAKDISLARNILNQLPEFPALVVLSNEIWSILNKIFEPIHAQSHALSEIQQLQRYAMVFRNVLASDQPTHLL